MKLIEINENGIAWVETEDSQIFGVVNAFEILDCDGLKFNDKSTMEVLEEFVDIDQDFEREANIIEFIESNGESYNLVITSDCVKLEGLS